MVSVFPHAFVATALGNAYARHPMPWYFWALSITCSILPDADVIGFAVGLPYDSPYLPTQVNGRLYAGGRTCPIGAHETGMLECRSLCNMIGEIKGALCYG